MRPPMPQAMANGSQTFNRQQQPMQKRNANQPKYNFGQSQIAKDLAAGYEDEMDQEADDDLLEMEEESFETPDWYYI